MKIKSQGQFYCIAGADNAFGRNVAENTYMLVFMLELKFLV